LNQLERKKMNLHNKTTELPASNNTEGIGYSESHLAPVLHRDPVDVRTILSLTWSGILLALLLVASIAFNIYQYWRRPDRIVVDRTSGRVLMINDRE
jgi:hypothetical protein